MKLQGKVAVVTGAGRGIGRACALELARLGADVLVDDLNYDSAAATAGEVRLMGRRAIADGADVADRAAVVEMMRRGLEELGRIDILVANAGTTVRKPFLELTAEDVNRTMAVTMFGVFHCCQLAAREMVRRGEGGNLIVISSVRAVLPVKDSLPYNGAKAAINHMARTMANELAQYRIRVNIIEPGWTDTPGERALHTEETIQRGGAALPLGRLASAEDIARGVAFLANDDAAYVTGSCLRIDGGYVLWR